MSWLLDSIQVLGYGTGGRSKMQEVTLVAPYTDCILTSVLIHPPMALVHDSVSLAAGPPDKQLVPQGGCFLQIPVACR